MTKNQKVLYDLMEDYFYSCKQNGYSDFEVWCEDNIENELQKDLLFAIVEHVNSIAWLLF